MNKMDKVTGYAISIALLLMFGEWLAYSIGGIKLAILFATIFLISIISPFYADEIFKEKR